MVAPTLTFDMYTIRDIAEALEVNVDAVYQWRHRGQMPEPDGRIGGTWVWFETTIRPWLEARSTTSPTADPTERRTSNNPSRRRSRSGHG